MNDYYKIQIECTILHSSNKGTVFQSNKNCNLIMRKIIEIYDENNSVWNSYQNLIIIKFISIVCLHLYRNVLSFYEKYIE